MNFKPKADHELNNLLEKGEYDFEVLTATDKISKEKGNEMIELKIAVYHGEEGRNIIFDYLLESVAYKLKHFCEATGLEAKYEAGCITAFDLEGKYGKCKVGVKVDKSGQYPDKNVISDYIKREPGDEPPPHTDDDMPF